MGMEKDEISEYFEEKTRQEEMAKMKKRIERLEREADERILKGED